MKWNTHVYLVKKQTRQRRFYLFVNRNIVGAFEILIHRHLIDNEIKFKEYLRVTQHLFSKWLDKIKMR